MAALEKSYFLAPRWDISPDDLKLGSVFSSFKRPEQPLSGPSFPEQIDTSIAEPPEEPTSGNAKTARNWSVGLFAKFMQLITVGGELSYSSNSVLEVEYSCNAMKTRRFTPSLGLIAKVVEQPHVGDYLRMGGLGSKVFMVTGVKSAADITITTTEEVETESTVQVGLDLPMIQTTIGPKGTDKKTQVLKQTRTIAGPIVFAFEVEKIKVNRKGKATSKAFVDGAMLERKGAGSDELVVECAGNDLLEEEIEDYQLLSVDGEDGNGKACHIIVPDEID
jgi:hypothetical protein